MNEQDLLLAEKLLGDDSKIQLTNYNWNASQKKQLLRNGNVDGFEIAFKRDVQKYSELANSLENVRFVARKRPLYRCFDAWISEWATDGPFS